MSATKQFFEDILNHYGARTSDLVAAALNNERFVQTVEKILVASLEFRDLVQKSVQAAFEQLNIPTREDVERLRQSLHDLEDRLFVIEETLERIEAGLGRPAKKNRPARLKKKPTPDRTEGAA
ncbi:MAG: hypothetical protein C4523_08415 [Myxococcales bacterium]|nr:MAG: hypothetical protein C4523_08415 [Myxococcales bacterium]